MKKGRYAKTAALGFGLVMPLLTGERPSMQREAVDVGGTVALPAFAERSNGQSNTD